MKIHGSLSVDLKFMLLNPSDKCSNHISPASFSPYKFLRSFNTTSSPCLNFTPSGVFRYIVDFTFAWGKAWTKSLVRGKSEWKHYQPPSSTHIGKNDNILTLPMYLPRDKIPWGILHPTYCANTPYVGRTVRTTVPYSNIVEVHRTTQKTHLLSHSFCEDSCLLQLQRS